MCIRDSRYPAERRRLPPARPPLRTDVKTLARTGTLYQRTILLDRLPEEKHRIRPGRPPCRTLLMEFLQTAEPGNRRNHLLFHRSPAHCHRLRYPLFHFQLYLRYLFPDKDHHIRRPGRRFPHPDSRYSILGRHPTVLIGRYRRVYRTYFQRDQKTPCLYRIGLQ